MTAFDTLVQIAVIVGFGVWAYSKVTKQTVGETINQIKDLIAGIKED